LASTVSPAPPVLSRDRLTLGVAAVLISASLASWAAVFYEMPAMTMGSGGMMGVAALVSSTSLSAIGLFELIWVVGMAAMMFPAMIPIVTFYNRFSTKVEPNPVLARAVGTPLFLAGYLAVYAGLGLAVYLGVFLAVGASSALSGLASLASVAPGAVLVFAGAYQLTPRKSTFLMQCVSPMGFFTRHSHRGLLGSFTMGLAHGEYCVGCCWAYMLVMFAVALMSLPFMVVLSVVIALEKFVLRGAVWLTRGIAAGLVLLGVASLVFPGVLGLLSAGL
jgi:predicted metal-binding membrane protein